MSGMKLNELVCPCCGLKCMTDAAYTTCASCNNFFYASQSRSVDQPAPMITITWPSPYVCPTIAPSLPLQWVVCEQPPNDPSATGSNVISTDDVEYQIWN